jgi:hypothetical protein
VLTGSASYSRSHRSDSPAQRVSRYSVRGQQADAEQYNDRIEAAGCCIIDAAACSQIVRVMDLQTRKTAGRGRTLSLFRGHDGAAADIPAATRGVHTVPVPLFLSFPLHLQANADLDQVDPSCTMSRGQHVAIMTKACKGIDVTP